MNIMRELIVDSISGTVSSRRVVTLLAFVMCCVAFISNLFFDRHIDEFIFNSMSYVVMTGLGVTVAEKFSKTAQIAQESRDHNTSEQKEI